MGNTSAKGGRPNEGQTDLGRGPSLTFPFTKGGRKTGKVGTSRSVPNSNTEDGNKRVVNDPRLA
jgi:hypothetical protein